MTDVSGSWLGTYWQSGHPTRFEATLVQGQTALSGRILDDSYLGEANLQGDITGRCITFTKQYFTSSPTPIHYSGTVSEDGNYMTGQWSIGKFDQGPWEAHRNDNDLSLDLQVTLANRVPTLATVTPSAS